MHETVSHGRSRSEDVGKEIKDVPKLDFSKTDPFAEVPEPVHQGKGAVFSPSTPVRSMMTFLGMLEVLNYLPAT